MIIDLTTLVTKDKIQGVKSSLDMISTGHLGTHFDVMDKEFPLQFIERNGIVFDVSQVKDRDIEVNDIEINLVEKDMFVAFYTAYIEKAPYGSKEYFKNHPQLSNELIDELLKRGISIIGIDCLGIRRSKEHLNADQKCADNGAFVIENMCNFKKVLQGKENAKFNANTYPVNYEGMSGLPCRVVAKI